MSVEKEALTLEILNAKTEALFNAVQILFTGLSEDQKATAAKTLLETADHQFSLPGRTDSQEARSLGARVSRTLAQSILESMTTKPQT